MTQMMVRIRILVAIVVIVFVVVDCILLFLMIPAHSQPAGAQGATPAQRKACTPDVYRLCAGEIPNVARITSCLRQNRARLSDACRAVFEQ